MMCKLLFMMFFISNYAVYGSQNHAILPSSSSWDLCSADSPFHLIKPDNQTSSSVQSSKKTSGSSLEEMEEGGAKNIEPPIIESVSLEPIATIDPIATEEFKKNTFAVNMPPLSTEKNDLSRKSCMPQFIRGAQTAQMASPNPILYPYAQYVPDRLQYTIPGVVILPGEEPEIDWLKLAKDALGTFFAATTVSSSETYESEESEDNSI